MKKALPYILYSLVILGAAGLLVYQGLITKTLEPSNLVKGILIILAAIVAMLRPKRRRKVSNKKVLYQKAYPEYVTGAFAEEPKLEKQFYNAVDDYNFGRYAAGISKLNKLRKECQSTADIYAVTVFTALCCDGMQAFDDAIKHYDDAARIRTNSTLLSNAGMCSQRLGKFQQAQQYYQRSIEADPSNAIVWNNMSALSFKQGDYTEALAFAKQAIALDPQMSNALGCAALCSALLGNQDDYDRYYRQAVASGYDGRKIKAAVQAMDSGL